mmetsp:Transcript_17281/g.35463  ORF Transcript_17281/g.35463 Transcript_17281/m.35463 type:complete len:486 (-) Transcript_17281:170-1627(-)|eukprot:CAMPEP_0183309628 /NCGR_PEP_ID=MMETSP0160_2-20130417/25455_1 /TAXON_ID=2839 ORGANISM="Odontella Sinensis, Strain Grunow 1884" /NCGR_SAMPLE_ID=MMETSP0160_2 /ASSEMBLY_ACC=CAM_ASM_000250 /LENGTH=485 /DNA_ID=CAMNT_0025473683 /DNA_START=73 /DNA_END=1530 /DNA_ORIENTATION=-
MSAWGRGGAASSCDALLRRVENNDPRLVDLVILPTKTFGRNEVERLASALSSGANTHLKSISASGHSVPPIALSSLGSAIAAAFDKNKDAGIISLAIGDESMGDDGVIAICTSLEPFNGGSLQILEFGMKNMTKSGMEAIGSCFGNSNLSHLNLSQNKKSGDDGIALLCKATLKEETSNAFPSLEYLDLSECNISHIGVKALYECLVKDNADARKKKIDLVLVSNPLGKDSYPYLSKLILPEPDGQSALVSLSLTSCSIGDDGIAGIVNAVRSSQCKGLQRLNLASNGISNQGAKRISEALCPPDHDTPACWVDLCELNLAGNPLGSEGVIILANSLCQRKDSSGTIIAPANSTLKVLELSDTNCSAGGAAAILKCGNLSVLHLFNNNLQTEGFDAITLLLQGGHPSLETIDLGGNRASEAAVTKILKAVLAEGAFESKLRTIILGGNEFGANAELALKGLNEAKPEIDVAHDRPSQGSWEDPTR